MRRKRTAKALRRFVLARDKGCVLCGETNRRILQVHHINENFRDNSEENLETLCIWCHATSHSGNRSMVVWAAKRGFL
jgi:5-methylcytosine-specific restriction endonuclease McrA